MLLAVLAIAFITGAVYLWRTGAVTPSTVGAWLDSLGPAAPVVFIAAFVGGAFVGLPGMAFVIGGRLAFGPYLGFAVAFIGGMLAVTVPFLAARRLGRTSSKTWRPTNRWLARAYALLERHPYRAVVLMRAVMWFNPPLSYALAFAPIRFTTYALACATSLAPIVAIAMIATGWFQ